MRQYRAHLLVLCVLGGVLLIGAHQALQNAITDKRFGWFPHHALGDIVLVAIDSPSMEQIGNWPWSRKLHADLIDRLVSAGAGDIVFDVDFSSPSTPDADRSFANALQSAGGSVVLPAFQQTARDGVNGKKLYVNRALPQFANQAWSAGVNVTVDPDGIVRQYGFGESLDGGFLPSVGAMLAGKYEEHTEPFQIDFSIGADTVPIVSYSDVLRADPAFMEKLKNKKVIIGATAIELGDRFNTPNGRIIAGPLMQLLAAESILQNRALHNSSNAAAFGGIGIIALLMGLLWFRISSLWRTGILVLLAVAIETGAIFLQAKLPIILDTSLYHIAIVAYIAAIALDEIDIRGLLSIIAERRFQRIAMSLGDGLVCADEKGLITVWNPGATAIFGYQKQEMIGQPLSRICSIGVGEKSALFSLDYLQQEELESRSGGKVMELEGFRKNAEAFALEASFSMWQGPDGPQYGAILRDITERKREAERIRYLAHYDTMTGLANRNTLHQYLSAKLAETRTGPFEIALLLIDLDKFKQINDMLGFAGGDSVLCAVVDRLKDLAEGTGLIARLGGDQFAIVLHGAGVADGAQALAERTCRAFRAEPVSFGARQISIRLNIGVALYHEDHETADALIGNADLALHRAKTSGSGRPFFYERSIRLEVEARRLLEAELERALSRGEFELFYQPQVRLRNSSLAGVEALIRWRHPVRGLVSPAEFMPVVNASSLSDEVALWVLTTACRQGQLWRQRNHEIRVGVNLSPSQFESGDLPATVEKVLKDTGFSPSLLELEVTEDILLEDDKKALEIFDRLQTLGVHLAFDDFGTGYGSLVYLKKFPLDRLKIDRSFVGELLSDSDNQAIVGATIGLGRILELSIIAEGIEDKATAEALASMGCEEGQGYYFGRPMRAAEFEQKFFSNDAFTTAGMSVGATATAAA